MKPDQYQEILDRLDSIAAMLADKPVRASGRVEDPRANLQQVRVREIERIFWKLVNSSPLKRRESYRFPRCLVESAGKPAFEGVVVSVLINQASLRKCFRAKGRNDPKGETAAQCARRVLDSSNLFLVAAKNLRTGSDADTLVALSPGEAERSVKSCVELPGEWPGWTCEDRAEPVPNPFAPGNVEVPEDPSGVRHWPGDGQEGQKSIAEPAKKLLPGFSHEGKSAKRKLVDLLALDDPAPAIDLTDLIEPQELGTDDPVVGFRQRVQFVEDEE